MIFPHAPAAGFRPEPSAEECSLLSYTRFFGVVKLFCIFMHQMTHFFCKSLFYANFFVYLYFYNITWHEKNLRIYHAKVVSLSDVSAIVHNIPEPRRQSRDASADRHTICHMFLPVQSPPAGDRRYTSCGRQ